MFRAGPTSASVLGRLRLTPIITIESLSKTHIVPGWRVGWMRFTNTQKMTGLKSAIIRLTGG